LIILFDLDDTLLENPMERFLPGYLQSLAQYLSDFIAPKDLPKAILNGTDQMVNNLIPSKTLEECFDDYFYPLIAVAKEKIEDKIIRFYREEFPKLAPLTNEIPQAATVIDQLFKDHKIIIATNPLFPKIAIDHRIKWAKLGFEANNFSYVTSFEEMHFTKPRPEYIAETLGKIGWLDEPAVMIGNEWDMDIVPAELLGLPTFFIGSPPLDPEIEVNPLSSNGRIEDIPDWISSLISKKIKLDLKNSKDALLSLLRSTAANLDSYNRTMLNPDQFSLRPKKDEWALIEIISHMADVDSEVNIPRIKLIQQNKTVFMEAALTDHWADERSYIKNNPELEIKRFIYNRIKLIEMIDDLSPDQWKSTVNHAIFGPTPISELVKFISQHDRIHINQMAETVKIIFNLNHQ